MREHQSERVADMKLPSLQSPTNRQVDKTICKRPFDTQARLITCTPGGSGAAIRALALKRATDSRPSPAGRSFLQLQRRYGNRYVRRVLALSRQEQGEAEVSPEVESAIEQARGGGQALDGGLRLQMESAFGADFSGVRVHADSEAHSLNEAVNAMAFTTGNDIFFRQGNYNPASSGGRELLAHELTHVVQQGGAPAVQGKLVLGEAGDPYEQEADSVARQVLAPMDGPGPALHRRVDPRTVQRICSECEEEEKKRGRPLSGAPANQTGQKEVPNFFDRDPHQPLQRRCACGGGCAHCRSDGDHHQEEPIPDGLHDVVAGFRKPGLRDFIPHRIQGLAVGSRHPFEARDASVRGRCPADGACDEDSLARHQGSGTTVCDRAAGTMNTTDLTEHCAGDCVAQHEAAHRVDDAECCRRVKVCLDNAGADAGKRAACNTAYDHWLPLSADHAECVAYTREVNCLTSFIADNCDGSKRAGIGATIGGIAGGILGGIGGFLVGGPVGAAVGAAGGAAVGAGIGYLAGRVSKDCCDTLRHELAFATAQKTAHCAAAVDVPCPFRADGSII